MKKELYPQQDKKREDWLNLNGKWDFSFDEPAFDREIEVPYPWGSPLSGISESKDGVGYYRRTVSFVPENERVFICLGAVDYTCEVKINGKTAGSHRGGYAYFEFDVTELWNGSGDNEIVVIAEDNGDPNRQSYGKQGYGNARGIWQTVWLESRPVSFIKEFFIKTKIDGTVNIDIETENAADGETVKACFGEGGELSAEAEVKDNKTSIQLNIAEPKLWSPDSPYLYEGALTMGGDKVDTYFGVREIGTGVFGPDKKRYITLNGKPIYLNGVLDQSFNPPGYFTLPSDEECKNEILRMKRIGLNLARVHVKAEEPLKLYYADKLGLLIMEDVPNIWGEPDEEMRTQYEFEMEAEVRRDRNHPSIVYWVLFNETWGLVSTFTREDGKQVRGYTDKTAEWVASCWKRVKELDPTRLAEDVSPCNHDHTLTDVNSWHFYANGYKEVKEEVLEFTSQSYPGSTRDFVSGYAMGDIPSINSECGNVWGIKNSAGMSDISWQYKYMINEFRLSSVLGGFIFTEFHDVINEFNGYYKIDNADKDFGYEAFGTSLRDLHSQDYVGADFAPMTTAKPGEEFTLPMFKSSFSDKYHGKTLTLKWQLCGNDIIGGQEKKVFSKGKFDIIWDGYGVGPAGAISVKMPDFDGVLVLSWTLCDKKERIMSNCAFFDVVGAQKGVLRLSLRDFISEGFDRDIRAIEGEKRSGLGSGEFSAEIRTADVPGIREANDLRLVFEASTREPMTHDDPDHPVETGACNYMLGYRCDPGVNVSTFPQTDETAYPGDVEVLIDGKSIGKYALPDCPADTRGLLSHHYQPVVDLLDEAGSYGYLVDLRIPSSMLFYIKECEKFTLTLRTDSGRGLSLYGRRSGRYGVGIDLAAEK